VSINHCERCGARVSTRRVDGRSREVCDRCGTIAYRNPLPVAAAVVLNDRREVLLVRRRNEPHAGMWCLPTGFAEVGETIDDAALRELAEETGVHGRVHRLLTARSVADDFYGDLLFICFEVEKTGGDESPGDDAEAIAYFPLTGLPPLAFEAHAEAVEICAALHREPWAIQDSFTSLYSESGEEMLSDALVTLVEERADEICDRWLQALADSPTTAAYHGADLTDVREAGRQALSRFCTWLLGSEQSGQAEDFYLELGRRRALQGFELAGVISALTLLRKEIWTFARERQVLANPLDVYRVMELSRRIVLFFDKALFHTARGFHEVKRQ
jgi:ADP-ribose pyrophosphatase YjhB (NUDIX family)